MLRKLTYIVCGLLLSVSFAHAQWTQFPTTQYPALNTLLNALPAYQLGSAAPTTQTCTPGKDFFTNTTASPAVWYICTGTNTWSSVLTLSSIPVTSVFGRVGAVVATAGDYTASQITNAAALNVANTWTGGGLQNFSAVDFLLSNHSSDPGSCTVGQMEFNTSSGFKGCTSANTWSSFSTGGGITQLTGDVTAGPGSGSVASTLATVNSGPGSCGDSTHVCQVTTNGKGLVTSQSAVGISSGSGNAAAVVTLSFSATPTFTCPSSTAGTVVDFQASGNAALVLTGNITSSTLSGCTAGSLLNFLLKQDATGGRTVSWPTGFPASQPTLAASTTTTMSFYWDGANARCVGGCSDAGYSQVTEGSAPGANPLSTYQYWNADSTRHTATVLNSSGKTHIVTQTACLTDQLCADDTTVVEFCTGGGTANAQTTACTPVNQVLSTGLTVRWLPSAGNTGATTINVDGLGIKSLTKCGTTALTSGDLTTAAIAQASYDGTQFQLLNAQSSGGGCGAGGGGGGSSFNPNDSTLMWFRDDFMGALISTSVGYVVSTVSYSLLGGGPGPTAGGVTGVAGHPGILALKTTTTSNSNTVIKAVADSVGTFSTDVNAADLSTGTTWKMNFIFRISVITNTTMLLGLNSSGSTFPASSHSGIWLQFDPSNSIGFGADTHFIFRCNNAGTATSYDTGVTPVANTWYYGEMKYGGSSSTVIFSFGTTAGGASASAATCSSTNFPPNSATVTPTAAILNSSATADELDLDFWSLQVPITR